MAVPAPPSVPCHGKSIGASVSPCSHAYACDFRSTSGIVSDVSNGLPYICGNCCHLRGRCAKLLEPTRGCPVKCMWHDHAQIAAGATHDVAQAPAHALPHPREFRGSLASHIRRDWKSAASLHCVVKQKQGVRCSCTNCAPLRLSTQAWSLARLSRGSASLSCHAFCAKPGHNRKGALVSRRRPGYGPRARQCCQAANICVLLTCRIFIKIRLLKPIARCSLHPQVITLAAAVQMVSTPDTSTRTDLSRRACAGSLLTQFGLDTRNQWL